ncbi:MAG: hypothetical protein ACLQT7_04625 [Candidatus Dormibacteria bacterium]
MSVAEPRALPAFPISARQMIRFVIGILWLGASQSWFGAPLGTPSPGFTVIAAGFGFVAIGGAMLVRGEEAQRRFDLLLLGFSVLFLLFAMYTWVGSVFESDEVAFGQQGAAFLLQGHDPFTANYAAALGAFGVRFGTPTLAGTVVHQFSYPAGSLLLLAPLVALLGFHSYAFLAGNFLATMASVAILVRRLPAQFLGALALLLLLQPIYFLLASCLDPLFLPFILVALLEVERFRAPDAGALARWASPVCLGIACSVKQNPWFLVPFLIVMAVMAARDRRARQWVAGLTYAGLVALTFLLVNLPFIIWSPSAWLAGALHPLTTPAVPWGLGMGTLLLLFGTGAFSLFSVSAVLAWISELLLYVRFYSRLKPAAPLLAVLPLMLTNRNPAEYFVLAPLLFAFLCAIVGPVSLPIVTGRHALVAAAALAGCLAVVVATAGLAVRPPLSVVIDTESASAHYFTATIEVVNHGSSTLTPHFIVSQDIIPEEPATVLDGPARLLPGASAAYRIRTPEIAGLPGPGQTTNFVVYASTTSPDTFAASPVAVCPC